MTIEFLDSARKQFEYYKSLGDKTFDQLDEADFFWQYNAESNSIAILVNHLTGNMLSRWTDFLSSDGEKSWRNRDQEFESALKTKEEVLKKWSLGWECLFTALDGINPDNFTTKIYIRNQEHSIIDAIHRQLPHYASHIGQIVFIGRMLKGSAWQSLSIPKGKSSEFNKAKFAKGKHLGHHTDDVV
ncbi:hypothetical protein GCM10011414_20160 [Croceivirga lutea]|uniref:DUF1572 family protein n=1 Tax=Croceivirga lutea TaxID=1775167 RepID=UPI001639939B|nr:DUF1572 family protein [Croceivirga lutea]GGG50495.1 hypothetical protein GCM10011414_20160 [Croceivirga lutea]